MFCRRPKPSISQTTSSPGLDIDDAFRRTCQDHVARAECHKGGQIFDQVRNIDDQIARIASLYQLAVDGGPQVELPGSATSSASTSHGPSAVQPSRFLTRRLGRYQFSR